MYILYIYLYLCIYNVLFGAIILVKLKSNTLFLKNPYLIHILTDKSDMKAK